MPTAAPRGPWRAGDRPLAGGRMAPVGFRDDSVRDWLSRFAFSSVVSSDPEYAGIVN